MGICEIALHLGKKLQHNFMLSGGSSDNERKYDETVGLLLPFVMPWELLFN